MINSLYVLSIFIFAFTLFCANSNAENLAEPKLLPDGTINASAFSSFSSCKADPLSLNRTIKVTKPMTTNTLTVTSPQAIEIVNNGQLNVLAGKTLTINSYLKSGSYKIFAGSGKVVFGQKSTAEVYPQWWGANPDGVTDSALAIQAAFNSGSAHVHFPSGTYRIGSYIVIPHTVHKISGAGRESTIITAAGINGAAIKRAMFEWKGGGFKLITSLARDVSKNDCSLEFSSDMSKTLSKGDVITLFNPTERSYLNARPYYYAGEMCEVADVNGTHVKLVSPLFASYKASNLIINKMLNPVIGTISGITFHGTGDTNDNYVGLSVRYANGVLIHDCYIDDVHNAGLSIEQSINVTVRDSEFNCLFDESTVNKTQYGAIISNCQNVKITQCKGASIRHAIAVGGTTSLSSTDPRHVNRLITVSDCTLSGRANALDAHGNTEYYKYINNNLLGGMEFSGNYGEISGNTINTMVSVNGSVRYSIVRAAELKGANFTISNNIIEVYHDTHIPPIYVNLYRDNTNNWYDTPGEMTIRNNKVFVKTIDNNVSNRTVSGISVSTSPHNTTKATVSIIDNEIISDVPYQYGIYVNGSSDVPNINVIINNNRIINGNIFLDNVEDTIINSNYVNAGGGYSKTSGINIINRAASSKVVCSSNTVLNSGLDGINISTAETAVNNLIVISNNILENSSRINKGAEIRLNNLPSTRYFMHGNSILTINSNNDRESIKNGIKSQL